MPFINHHDYHRPTLLHVAYFTSFLLVFFALRSSRLFHHRILLFDSISLSLSLSLSPSSYFKLHVIRSVLVASHIGNSFPITQPFYRNGIRRWTILFKIKAFTMSSARFSLSVINIIFHLIINSFYRLGSFWNFYFCYNYSKIY